MSPADKAAGMLPAWGLSRAESARQKDDQADEQNQANRTAAENGATEVKPAAAQQEQQQENDKYCIHGSKKPHGSHITTAVNAPFVLPGFSRPLFLLLIVALILIRRNRLGERGKLRLRRHIKMTFSR